ncbi:MAG: tyrosine-type recombinase/integrase [Oscillospiraceae bacterium]|nr:tyrosine-type recombinase/integrase [Oscillospiraceae bacterium]
MELMRTGPQALRLSDLESLETGWMEYIRDRQKATQQSYKVCLGSFIEWAKDNGIARVTDLSRSDIVDYLEYLRTPHTSRKTGREITLSADTQKRYYQGLKVFLRWVASQGYPHIRSLTDDVMPPKSYRDPKHPWKRDRFHREDVLKILESIDRSTEIGLRNYAMILLCISCGLRIIEIMRADIGSIEKNGTERKILIQGKGHTEPDTSKTIAPEVWDAIDAYLERRGVRAQDAPLFAACASNAKPGGGRLSEVSISRIIKNVIVKAGYDSKRLTPHSLRHTSITLDREAGASIDEASRHARHSSIAITALYDHLLEGEAATDEARIMDYLFSGKDSRTDQEQAADLIARIPADKRAAALELLAALAE